MTLNQPLRVPTPSHPHSTRTPIFGNAHSVTWAPSAGEDGVLLRDIAALDRRREPDEAAEQLMLAPLRLGLRAEFLLLLWLRKEEMPSFSWVPVLNQPGFTPIIDASSSWFVPVSERELIAVRPVR